MFSKRKKTLSMAVISVVAMRSNDPFSPSHLPEIHIQVVPCAWSPPLSFPLPSGRVWFFFSTVPLWSWTSTPEVCSFSIVSVNDKRWFSVLPLWVIQLLMKISSKPDMIFLVFFWRLSAFCIHDFHKEAMVLFLIPMGPVYCGQTNVELLPRTVCSIY